MRRMVEDVLNKLQPDGLTVLDIGCGTGVLGVPIAQRASKYTGVDLSPEAVAVLAELLPSSDIRWLDITRDDLDDLGMFDRVLAYAVLHYVASEAEGERFVRRALERLTPGGRALFGNIPLPNPDLPHSVVEKGTGLLWSARGRIQGRPKRAVVGGMPAGYCLPLTRVLIDGWLQGIPAIRWRWVAPRTGVPMQRRRADLLVEKSLE
jgi:SAM-dependent methyltransferase